MHYDFILEMLVAFLNNMPHKLLGCFIYKQDSGGTRQKQ